MTPGKDFPPPLVPGQPAPHFQLRAVESNRLISTDHPASRALVLTFHDRTSLDALRELQAAVRTAYPSADDVLMASVADLSRVPRPLRRMVAPVLKQVYSEAARFVPIEMNPADYVVILPDWTGEVAKLFGAHRSDKEPFLVVIDRGGRVVGSYRGKALAQAAMAFLSGLTA